METDTPESECANPAQIMNCSTCVNWQIIAMNGSDRGDSEMVKLGWKNCKANKQDIAYAMFYHSTHKCEKYENCRDYDKRG